jgi:GNAT superfamily N-acetyltransferase
MIVTPLRLDPDAAADLFDCGSATTSPLALNRWERALLDPAHPFLRIGTHATFLAYRGETPVARVVAGLDPRQIAGSGPVGSIGFVAHTGDADALRCAVADAEIWLAANGAGVMRCPVQLSTWFGHRLALGVATCAPPYPMEPADVPGLAAVLADLGYAPAHRATSHVVEHAEPIAYGRRDAHRMERAGFRDRPLDPGCLALELAAMHRVAGAAFAQSWGFHPISLAEFTALYLPFASGCDPELVRIVESGDGEPVGFAFAYPGPSSRLGERIDITEQGERRFVLKSIAVLPDATGHGIGPALIATIHRIARARGYAAGIHALVAEGSSTQRTSARWAKPFRHYATFERRIRDGGNS